MKHFNLIAGATLVAAIALTMGMGTYAQNNTGDYTHHPSMHYMKHLDHHTTEEREELFAEMEERRNAIDEAMEAGDYLAWAEAVAGTPHGDQMLEAITEAEFPRLVEAHQLMVAARTQMDKARSIMEELGVEHRSMKPFGRMKH